MLLEIFLFQLKPMHTESSAVLLHMRMKLIYLAEWIYLYFSKQNN